MFKKISTAAILLLVLLFHAWLAAAADQKLLEDIIFEASSEQEERITFKLNGTYIPRIFALKGEKPRVVFDFPDTRTARVLKNIINTNGKFIKRIRIGLHNEPDPKTRVVFDLVPGRKIDFKHDFDQQQNSLIITVFHAGAEPENTPAPLEEKKPSPPKQPEKAVTEASTPPPIPVVPDTPAETTPAPESMPDTTVQTTGAPEPVPDTQVSVPETTLPPAPTPTVIQNAEVPAPEPVQVTKQQSSLQKQENVKPVPEEAAQTDKPAGLPILRSVTFDDSTNRGEMVLFKLNKFHSPIVFGVEEGLPRIVCDFKETVAADDLPDSIKVNGKFVKAIRIGREKTPQKIRVVLDLAKNNSYDLQQVFFKDDNLFVIIINTLNNTAKTQGLKKPLQ